MKKGMSAIGANINEVERISAQKAGVRYVFKLYPQVRSDSETCFISKPGKLQVPERISTRTCKCFKNKGLGMQEA